jgi:hypothetical protein
VRNYIVSYDLNGPAPTHSEMDQHLFPIAGVYGRLLETVWYLTYEGNAEQLLDYLDQALGLEDRVLVVEIASGAWRNLLVPGDSLMEALKQNGWVEGVL